MNNLQILRTQILVLLTTLEYEYIRNHSKAVKLFLFFFFDTTFINIKLLPISPFAQNEKRVALAIEISQSGFYL